MAKRISVTNEKTLKLVTHLSTLSEFGDEKGVIDAAVKMLWEQKGVQVVKELQSISPVAKFIGDSEKQEAGEMQQSGESLEGGNVEE